MRSGQLRFVKIGARTLVTDKEVEAYLAARVRRAA
jgi:hypothetical protein